MNNENNKSIRTGTPETAANPKQVNARGRNNRQAQPMTRGEVLALLQMAAGSEWRGVILTGYCTGQRLGDIVALRWRSIDLGQRTVRFYQPKSPTSTAVPMTDELHGFFASLAKLAEPEAPVFPELFKLAQKSPDALAAAFRRLQAKAGLPTVGFKALRVTFVTALRMAAVPDMVVKQAMGISTGWNAKGPGGIRGSDDPPASEAAVSESFG